MGKNILITHIHINTGGIETSLVNMLNMLDKKKYNIDLLLYYPNGELLNLIPKHINVIPVWNTHKKDNTKLKKLVLSRRLQDRLLKNLLLNKHTVKKFIPNKHYDIAIAYSGYFEFTDLIAGMANADKKYIWSHADFFTQCKLDKNFRKKFQKIYSRYYLFDKIICVSSNAANNLKNIAKKYADKIDFLWNFNLPRNIDKNEDFILKGDFKIVTISRLYKYKGIERLIEACRYINKPFKLYVLGDGPYKEQYKLLIKQYNLQDKIILLGNVLNVFNILKQADLYVSSSDAEGLSNVILESLMCNTPVISTPTAGAKEIEKYIVPKNAMTLCSDFNAKNLAEKIQNFKLNKDFTFNIQDVNNKILDKLENNFLN